MTLRRTLLLGGTLLLAPAVAHAQGVEAVGIRALGMGGAFVAVADDASATYWNPAGLVTGDVVSVLAETGLGRFEDAILPQRPGTPNGTLASSRLGGTLVALGTWPLGATFYRLASSSARVLTAGPVPPPQGTAAALERLTTTHAGVNVLQTIVPGLHVGATVKYVYGAAGARLDAPAPTDALDAAGDLPTVGTHRFDMDAGVIADVRRLKLGLTVRNLFEPDFDTPTPGQRLELPRLVRAGVAVRATGTLMISLDADLTRTPDAATGERRSLAAGAEQRFWQNRAAVRGGFRVSTTGETRSTVTTGGSVALRSGLFADAYVAVALDEAERDAFGVGLRVAF
jgi:hypothetical protein